jgi:hypothetical protein
MAASIRDLPGVEFILVGGARSDAGLFPEKTDDFVLS